MVSRRVPQVRRSRLEAGAVVLLTLVLLVVFILPLLTAPRASAATAAVQLSSDGVNFSSTFTGSLFADTALMVPMSSQSARFWVKNASGEPAYLRVSIGNVTGAGTPLSGALKIKGGTPSVTGSWVAVDAAAPCYVLTQGQLLQPGDVMRVDASLALGDMNGTWGQASHVDFDILAGLSSAVTGSMPSTTCLTDSGTVTGTPDGGGGGGGGGPAGTDGTGTAAQPSGSAVGSYDGPGHPDGSAYAEGNGSVGILDTNTGRLYQEWFVALWVAAVFAGGGLCLLVARRRVAEEDEEEEEVTGWLVDVPISGRKAWSTTSGWA